MAVVLGVGMHPWGKFRDKSFVDLGIDALVAALADAGLEWRDVQALHAAIDPYSGITGLTAGNHLALAMGETGIAVTNSFNACASGGMALRQAFLDVSAGQYSVAVAIGASRSPDGFLPPLPSQVPVRDDQDRLRWECVGATNPAYWAIECRRRMQVRGTTDADLATVKVLLSESGSLNPNARFRRTYTIDEVLASPMVADPLHLLEICATSDGAAAVVLVSDEFARRHTTRPVHVRALRIANSVYGDPSVRIPFVSAPSSGTAPRLSESVVSARLAFEDGGIAPEDIDFVELPDNSTWHVLEYLESAGLCAAGEAEGLVRDRAIARDGRLPVGPSGGFASFGEAIAAQGLAQICELTWQLRGDAGGRQLTNTRVGLSQTYGATGNASTAILSV